MIIYLSALVCLLGVLLYFIASKAEVKEVGRLMFAVGLLAFLMRVESVIHLP